MSHKLRGYRIAHFGKSDSLGPKLWIVWRTSRVATFNYDETCKFLCAFVHK